MPLSSCISHAPYSPFREQFWPIVGQNVWAQEGTPEGPPCLALGQGRRERGALDPRAGCKPQCCHKMLLGASDNHSASWDAVRKKEDNLIGWTGRELEASSLLFAPFQTNLHWQGKKSPLNQKWGSAGSDLPLKDLIAMPALPFCTRRAHCQVQSKVKSLSPVRATHR